MERDALLYGAYRIDRLFGIMGRVLFKGSSGVSEQGWGGGYVL